MSPVVGLVQAFTFASRPYSFLLCQVHHRLISLVSSFITSPVDCVLSSLSRHGLQMFQSPELSASSSKASTMTSRTCQSPGTVQIFDMNSTLMQDLGESPSAGLTERVLHCLVSSLPFAAIVQCSTSFAGCPDGVELVLRAMFERAFLFFSCLPHNGL